MTTIDEIRFDYAQGQSETDKEYALRLLNRCADLGRQAKEAEDALRTPLSERGRDRQLLIDLKDKLGLYYLATDGRYVGGQENSALVRRIEDELAERKRDG